MHRKARDWDRENGQHTKTDFDPDYWLFDSQLGCLLPNARPCDSCGEVTPGLGYLCDACAEAWCERVIPGNSRKFQEALLIGAATLNWPTWKSSNMTDKRIISINRKKAERDREKE
jgi:hypothetical protein